MLKKFKRRKISPWLLLTGTLLLMAQGVQAIEEAEYAVVRSDDRFEIRDYEPAIVAEVLIDGDFEEAGDMAFRKLFNYISGDNTSSEKIAMTAPVSQEKRSEKIAMTAPVSQSRGDHGWAVSFMMPASYTPETIPRPDNPEVVLREIPAQRMAAVRYSGFWSEKNYAEQLEKLIAWLEESDLRAAGDPVWARYNAPFTPWFMRRNEILIPVEG